jgi:prepilin peptidase CpaA
MPTHVQAFAFLPAYFLIATMLAATLTDIVSHRIPNVLLAPALSLALVSGAVTDGPAGVFSALAGMGVGLAMLLPMYAMGAMGAGDVKLLGVAGAFLGPQGALIAGLMTFVSGGVFGLLWIAWRFYRPAAELLIANIKSSGMRNADVQGTSSPAGSNNTFAYAPAIAAGVAIAGWQQGWLIPSITG